MTEKTIQKQIEEIVAEGERLLSLELEKAEKLADKHGEIFYAGDYGYDGRTYYSLGGIEKLKEKDVWMYEFVHAHLGGGSGWVYSSETC